MRPKYFYLDESPVYKERYVLRANFDLCKFTGYTRGSYGVFPARLLGVSYATYLRYCRDVLGADLVGKNARYVTPYFMDTEEVKTFVKLLNLRMEYVLDLRRNPYKYKQVGDEVERTPIDFNG